MGNPFCHVELHTTDLDKARPFYETLFNWQVQDIPTGDGTYAMIQVGDGTGGGMMTNPVPDAPSHWLPYVAVDDIAKATKQAKKLGATIVQDQVAVPDYGTLSVFQDPTGAVLGLWQPAS